MPKRLWANMRLLSSRSAYFSKLFRAPHCASHNVTHNQFKALSDITLDYRISTSPNQVSSNDSDRDENQNPIGRFRKPRWMNVASTFGAVARLVRYVIVKHCAFRTFRAMLHFLEAHQGPDWATLTSFRPYKVHAIEEPYISTSPKSLYRLAHQLQIPQLCTHALAAYKHDIRPENCLTELISEYTTLYPDLRNAIVEQIASMPPLPLLEPLPP